MARKPTKQVAKAIDRIGDRTGEVIDGTSGVSPNPMTNLLLTDLVLRGGGQIMRHAVERTILGTRYPKEKAKNIVKGRSMAQTMISTALARIATRSVPGAIIVGGAMLAKTLYDRSKGQSAVRRKGASKVRAQAAEGRKESDPIVT
jgi:hypothetical protein